MGVVTYDAAFFDIEAEAARRSAAVVMPWLLDRYPQVCTVIDVGCGTGEWSAAAYRLGCAATGVDAYAEPLPDIGFVRADLTGGYPCDDYDLAICLEVAEHLPAEAAEPLVAGLAGADLVLFSAATPGQPGVGHINCQPHDYWHDLFAVYGLHPTHIGSEFAEPVADFYRRNLFLYERPWRP